MAMTVRNTFIQMAAVEVDDEKLDLAIDFKRHYSDPLPKASLKASLAHTWQDHSTAASSLSCDVLEDISGDTYERGISRDTLASSNEGEHVGLNCSSGSDKSWSGDDVEVNEVPWARLVTDDDLDKVPPVVDVDAKKHAKVTLSLDSAITEQASVHETSEHELDNSGFGKYQRNADVKPPAMMVLYPAFQARQNLAESVGPEQTLMVRNMPNKYSRDALVGELRETGFHGAFDFLYLPIDPDTRANKGFAFINFVNTQFARVFMSVYQHRKMSRFNSDKRISVTPAALQGFAANYQHYSKKYVNLQDESVRPLFLRAFDTHEFQENQPVPAIPNPNNVSSRRGNRTSLIDKAVRVQTGSQTGPTGSWIAGSHPNVLVPPVSAQQKKMQARDFLFCVHCGTKVLASFKFCQSCGESIEH